MNETIHPLLPDYDILPYRWLSPTAIPDCSGFREGRNALLPLSIGA
jgi:hypothetical protein